MNKPHRSLSNKDRKTLQRLLDGPQYNGDLMVSTGIRPKELRRLQHFRWISGNPEHLIKITESGKLKLHAVGQLSKQEE